MRILLSLNLIFLFSCNHKKPGPEYIFMEMADSQSTIPMRPNDIFQNANSMQDPPVGTINHEGTPYNLSVEEATELTNPVPRTVEYMERGKIAYDRYCMVCHGDKAEGNGTIFVSNKMKTGFPTPPSLNSKKIRETWSDGRIYHVIMTGQNNIMPSYAARIAEVDRWSIIHYLRALAKSEYATKQDKERVANGKF